MVMDKNTIKALSKRQHARLERNYWYELQLLQPKKKKKIVYKGRNK